MKLIKFTALESTGYETVIINADKIVGLAADRDSYTGVPTGAAVLVLDGGIAIELVDSFEEAEAKLRRDGTLHGCEIVGEEE